MEGKKSYLARRRRCLAGLAASLAVETIGGVVAHGRQLQAAVLLFQAAERDVIALPLSSSVSFFFLFFRFQVVSLFVLPALLFVLSQTLPCFELPRILSFLYFVSSLFYSLRPLFFPCPLCWC